MLHRFYGARARVPVDNLQHTAFAYMLICHCHRVNDRTILDCAAEGARTVAQVGRRCGAGTGCGGCVSAVREVLENARRPLPMAPIATHPLSAEPALIAS